MISPRHKVKRLTARPVFIQLRCKYANKIVTTEFMNVCYEDREKPRLFVNLG